jgi:hypothetical protein
MSKHNRRQFAKAKRPKTKLGLPDLNHSKSAVLNSLRSPESKRGYAHAIEELIQSYCSEPHPSFNKAPHDLRRSCAKLCHAAGGELLDVGRILSLSFLISRRTEAW